MAIKEAKKKYNQKVQALEVRNDESAKINGLVTTETTKWSVFKSEFDHQMDELSQAFKEI